MLRQNICGWHRYHTTRIVPFIKGIKFPYVNIIYAQIKKERMAISTDPLLHNMLVVLLLFE